MPVTLAQLRTRIRQRSDNEHTGSSFVTDDELNQLINTSHLEMYGILMRASILDVRPNSMTITTDGSQSYEIPWQLAAIQAVNYYDGQRYYPLVRHGIHVVPDPKNTNPPMSYRSMAGAIEFDSRSTGHTVRITYIQEPLELVDDVDEVYFPLGWEEYIVLDVAIKVLQKEEAPGGILQSLKEDRQRILKRVEEEASAQEHSQSYTIASNSGQTPLSLRDLWTWWRR